MDVKLNFARIDVAQDTINRIAAGGEPGLRIVHDICWPHSPNAVRGIARYPREVYADPVSLRGFLLRRCTMYERILLAYDGSAAGQKALLDCRDIAQWSHSAIFLVAVMSLPVGLMGVEGGYYSFEMVDQEKQKQQGTLDEGLRRLGDAGYKARGEVLVGDVVQEITRYARKMEADLIVVGHKHLDNWAARWWRGSISSSMIEHSLCSVLVVITS